jgi:hypothetical protein
MDDGSSVVRAGRIRVAARAVAEAHECLQPCVAADRRHRSSRASLLRQIEARFRVSGLLRITGRWACLAHSVDSVGRREDRRRLRIGRQAGSTPSGYCASTHSARGLRAIGSAFEPSLPGRGTAGSGAAALAPGGRPAFGIQSPQLLLRVATGGADQPATDCPLPSRRNQLLLDAPGTPASRRRHRWRRASR